MDGWSLVEQIDGFPGLKWRVHNAEPGSALLVVSDNQIKEAEKAMSLIFAPAPQKFSSSLQDGNGRTHEIKGFELGPEFTTSMQATGISRNGLHEASEISLYRPFVYNSGDLALLKGEPINAASLAERILLLLERMQKAWASADETQQVSDGLSDKERAALVALNVAVYPRVQQMLRYSFLTTTIAELSTLPPAGQVRLNEWLVAMLRTPGSSFFSALQSMSQHFHFFYEPPSAGGTPSGRLVTYDDLFAEPPADKEVDVNPHISIQPGSRELLPIHRVVVTGVRTTLLKQTDPNQDTKSVQTPVVYLGYPDAPLGRGRTEGVEAPPFLPTEMPDIPGEDDDGYGELSCEEFAATRASAEAASQETATLYRAMLRRHARLRFYAVTLGSFTASLSSSLDFSWQAGKRFSVRSGGATLFTGLLVSVTHTLETGAGGGGAMTSLAFSHVEIGAFSLRAALGE